MSSFKKLIVREQYQMFILQLLDSTSKEKNEALQKNAASLEDQLKGQKVKTRIKEYSIYCNANSEIPTIPVQSLSIL